MIRPCFIVLILWKVNLISVNDSINNTRKGSIKLYSVIGYGTNIKLDEYKILSNFLDTRDYKKYNILNTFNASILAIYNKKYILINTFEYGTNYNRLKYRLTNNGYSFDLGYAFFEKGFYVCLTYKYSHMNLISNEKPDSILFLTNNIPKVLSPITLNNKFHSMGINLILMNINDKKNINYFVSLNFLFSILNNQWKYYNQPVFPPIMENFNFINVKMGIIF